MSDAAAPAAADAAPEGAKRSAKGLLIGVIAAAVLAGAAAGALLVGPKLFPASAAAAVAKHEAKPAEAEKPGRIVRFENLIVNPAGSDGARFLMTTVAFEVADEAQEKLLHEKEVQIRDEIIAVLAANTLADLTAPTARQTLKARLAGAVQPVLGGKVAPKVYLPQFVIQ